ncbi:MAG: mcrC [Fibrobacteres bacterium]|nr:mcrC [Fibrobacterota bacterium]
MPTRTLFENDVLEAGDMGGPATLSLHQKRVLAALEPSLPKGMLNWTAQGVRLGPFCGVLQVGSETWEILPKIWRDGKLPERNRGALLRLLRYSRRLPWLESWPGALSLQRHHLLDVFIARFCRDLEAALAAGPLRAYHPVEKETAFLRGRLNVAAHSRRLPGRQHRLDSRFDEFDLDIPLNRVLSHCLERLSMLAVSPLLRSVLETLRSRFGGVSPWRFDPLELERLRPDRAQAAFAAVWEQCKWLLRGLYPDASSGSHPRASLLFDLEELFEEAVSRAVRRELSPLEYQCRFQGPRRPLLADAGGIRKSRPMRPDIHVVSRLGRRIVIDCKWKSLDAARGMFGVSQADLYQLHTYAAEYGAQAAGLIYPWAKGLPTEPVPYRFREIDVPVWLVFVPLEDFAPGRILARILEDPEK